jgi:hypothetical protein
MRFILGYKIDSENSDKIKIFFKVIGKPTINAIKLIKTSRQFIIRPNKLENRL